ncbi:MAG: translation elongation factor Ts [Deltaproteobacteria bacterium]|jgi:elongation factor Ts|nr:translation elongation factor Ts [Deltaproteobacteria bacterium]
MEITAKMVKELRDKTNAGMMDCKKALRETGGDMEKARDWLREHGLATVNKRSGRVAREGVVATAISEDGKKGGIVEFNTETDFVAKLESFRGIAKNIATALTRGPACSGVDALLNVTCPVCGRVFSEVITENTATTGEKSEIRRFAVMETEAPNAFLHAYDHAGEKLSVLLMAACEKPGPAAQEAAHTLAMQIAASNPLAVAIEDLPAEVVERERKVAMEIARQTGKDEKYLAKIAEGQLTKFYEDCVLLEQEYIREPKLTVGKWLDSLKDELGAVSVQAFVRYQLAEELASEKEPDAE